MPVGNEESGVFEVFAQFGSGRALELVGTVRSSDTHLAWHAAKEAYTRREHCTALWVVPRSCVLKSDHSDAENLLAGDRNRWRLPGFPSSHRRSRAASSSGSGSDEVSSPLDTGADRT